MEHLHFYPVCGLFDELYNPCLSDLSIQSLQDSNELYRLNGLFWGQLLSSEKIDSIIEHLRIKYHYQSPEILKYAAIIANPELFKHRVETAIKEIVDQSTPEPVFFGAIETISILCQLYSDFLFQPNKLTIADGFLINEYSSKDLVNLCHLTEYNPYLPFLESECFPLIEKSNATIAYIHGPIRMSTIAMARKTKELFPNIHISVIGHSSEYYSLTKIVRFLKKNKMLFKVIDSIVLEDEVATQKSLEQAIINGTNLSTIKNILYYDKQTETIIQTEMSEQCSLRFADNLAIRLPSHVKEEDCIDPSSIVSGKLFPNSFCPWHKCSFCGINQKYMINSSNNEGLSDIINEIKRLIQDGVKYFWFFDEALTSNQLNDFAQAIIDAKLTIVWHCRSRFDQHFTKQLCEKLALSGLREIRLGLESASLKIQKLMNKFESFSLAEVEGTIRNFNDVNIGIHCPILIGMPNETFSQRHETYDFLAYLKRKYSFFTFNINILELDVTSKLYIDFENYGITGIKLPCKPEYFMGNTVEVWADEQGWFNRDALAVEQNDIMRKLLFPWMPVDAITPPNIHYRLTETIRNTLIWKSGNTRKPPSSASKPLTDETELVISPWVQILHNFINRDDNGCLTMAFDFRYNQNVCVDNPASFILSEFLDKNEIFTAIDNVLSKCDLPRDAKPELRSFIEELYTKGFLWQPHWIDLVV